jgi:hypothetical protein
MAEPLYRLSYDAELLAERYPPVLKHPNKSVVLELARRNAPASPESLQVTRWSAFDQRQVSLPPTHDTSVRAGYYDYVPDSAPLPGLEWHVNFADPRLFVAYGSGLFAQDEMQVAEHPILGSLVEALKGEGHSIWTCDDSGPTPILVQGAVRRVHVQTEPDAAAGRPRGLYGNLFAAADEEVIRRATRVINPPTISNLIAIAAPAGGSGEYREQEIREALSAAMAGFTAARLESQRTRGPSAQTVVHSGFWGCGAFGGNRVLMIALQSLAARAAGIDRLILHVGDPSGIDVARRGLDVADALALRCGPEAPLAKLIDRCLLLGYRWGVSDGN